MIEPPRRPDPGSFYGILYDMNSKAWGTEIHVLGNVNEVYSILALNCEDPVPYPLETLPSASVKDRRMAQESDFINISLLER